MTLRDLVGVMVALLEEAGADYMIVGTLARFEEIRRSIPDDI